MIVHFIITSLNSNIVYRIFLSSNVFTTFVILLFTCNIKILVLVVPPLNESGCVVLRVITFVPEDISMVFIMSSSLFLVSRISSDFTLTLVSLLLTFYSLETSSLSISLSPESSLDSFSDEEDSFEILDSSSLESFSSSPMVLSR